MTQLQPDMEVTLAEVDDPDFGRLALVQRTFSALWPPDPTERRFSYCQWRGAVRLARSGPTAFSIGEADAESRAPRLSPVLRRALLKIAAAEAEILDEVARRELARAIDWAENGDLPTPTAQSFSAGLRANCISLDTDDPPEGVELWLDDLGEIFGGHGVRVTLDLDAQIRGFALEG